MQVVNPQAKVRRVRLTAVDPSSVKPSKTVTLYDCDPDEAIEFVRTAAISKGRESRKRANVPS